MDKCLKEETERQTNRLSINNRSTGLQPGQQTCNLQGQRPNDPVPLSHTDRRGLTGGNHNVTYLL